jgi:peptidoglycan/LPS O-acetylase OafA/YrhL
VTRFENLDMIRGFASLVVTAFHGLLYLDLMFLHEMAAFYLSPASVLVSGGSAVLVFFVLSGFVLGHSLRKYKDTSQFIRWIRSRMVRLYFPIFPVLLVFWILQISLFKSYALNLDSVFSLLLDSTLIFGTGGILAVLWSLRWEIIFSLILPWIVRFDFKSPLILLALSILFSQLGNALNVGILQYLPMLFCGYFLYKYSESIELRENEQKNPRHVPLRIVSSICLLSIESSLIWLFGPAPTGTQVTSIVGQFAALLGAIILIRTLSQIQLNRNLFVSSGLFLGKISFSLFLIHAPVLFIINKFLLPSQSVLIVLMLGIMASIVIASFYWKVIEQKTHKMARRLLGHY